MHCQAHRNCCLHRAKPACCTDRLMWLYGKIHHKLFTKWCSYSEGSSIRNWWAGVNIFCKHYSEMVCLQVMTHLLMTCFCVCHIIYNQYICHITLSSITWLISWILCPAWHDIFTIYHAYSVDIWGSVHIWHIILSWFLTPSLQCSFRNNWKHKTSPHVCGH